MTSRTLPASRTAVVTGAASQRGIGRATARRLAADGWSIAALDLDGEAVAELAASLTNAYGVDARGLATDITDPDSVADAVLSVGATLPPVVGLANVAGVSSPVPFLELTPAEWDRVFNVNMRGQFLVTQAFLPAMISQGIGRVVTLSSASAQRGGGTYGKVPYSASKAAVLGFTRALAREVGDQGVTVNAVAPGPIDTDIMGGTLSDERKADLIADLIVDRVGTVEDVAAVVRFLMSDDAGYITGTTYNVNGGLVVD